jgi:hypothetical protein
MESKVSYQKPYLTNKIIRIGLKCIQWSILRGYGQLCRLEAKTRLHPFLENVSSN